MAEAVSGCPAVNYLTPSITEYASVFEWRIRRLREIEQLSRERLSLLCSYYRTHPWDYISDWGVTFDPRHVELDLPSTVPMLLWSKQVDYLKWIYDSWRLRRRGLVEKSRDCGVSWLSVAFAGTMWLFQPGFTALFGSRVEDLVDMRGDMDSLFEKLWFFLDHTPSVFRPAGFSDRLRAHMRIVNPVNRAAITGKAGDNIGRGGRSSIAFVDEAAFIEHQQKVDNALSQTTNCQIDISTPNGNGNVFYKKRMKFNGTDRVFIFDWRDDPRKNDAWYEKQKLELDEVTLAQEIDRDYEASQEDSFIPAKWVRSAIDAHLKLGFIGEGIKVIGFDPADVGDAKACVGRHGSVIDLAEEKRQGDITVAIGWAYQTADDYRAEFLTVDGDGMGAPVMKVSLESKANDRIKIRMYHGSGGVKDPGKPAKRFRQRSAEAGKSNIDTYENFRAQSWMWLRDRFEATHVAITRAAAGQLVTLKAEDCISIATKCTEHHALVAELSRPMRKYTPNGKIKVESKADMKSRGVDSPNLADAAVMAFSETGNVKVTAPPQTTPGPSRGSWMGR